MSTAQSDYTELTHQLRNTIQKKMEKMDIPGLSIALVDGKDMVWAEGFGFTDHTRKTAVTADTLFSIQSSGKMFTATAFLMAASRQMVHLDDPLRRHYPQFTVNSRFGEGEVDRITFRHLLSHHAGLCHEAPLGNNYDERTCTFDEHIASIGDTWLKSPVGQRFSYSNLGMDLTAYALQLISGRPFAQFMEEDVLRSMGITKSTYHQERVFSTNQYARGHRGPNETPNHRVTMLGAGGLFVSAREAAKFISFHLAGGRKDGKSLIEQALLKEMYTIQYPVEGQVCGFGLGTIIEPRFGTRMIYHPGGGMGYQTMQAWLPEYDLGVVILLNQSGLDEPLTTMLTLQALKGMVQTKYGSAPEDQPLPDANRTVIELEPEQLHRLEGKYRISDNVTGNTSQVQEKNGDLFLNETKRLQPFEPTGFKTEEGVRVTFHLDDQGLADKMCILGRWGYSQNPLDHAFRQEKGPEKAAWKQFKGIYTICEDGLYFFTVVSLKKGYLAVDGWMGDALLEEYQPDLFFTAEGETVSFREDGMLYGNAAHIREDDPCRMALDLAETDQTNPRLTRGALGRLREAYLLIGDQEKVDLLAALDARLHPEQPKDAGK